MTKAVVSSGGDGTGDGDRAYGFNIRAARDGVQAVSKVPLYKFLFSCLVFLSSLPCCRELLSFRRGLGQVRQFCCFWKSSSADIPVLLVSPSADLLLCGHHDSTRRPRLSAPSFGGQGLPLFFLHFHDIDDHPAIRLLYSWLLCIIHRRSPPTHQSPRLPRRTQPTLRTRSTAHILQPEYVVSPCRLTQ